MTDIHQDLPHTSEQHIREASDVKPHVERCQDAYIAICLYVLYHHHHHHRRRLSLARCQHLFCYCCCCCCCWSNADDIIVDHYWHSREMWRSQGLENKWIGSNNNNCQTAITNIIMVHALSLNKETLKLKKTTTTTIIRNKHSSRSQLDKNSGMDFV